MHPQVTAEVYALAIQYGALLLAALLGVGAVWKAWRNL